MISYVLLLLNNIDSDICHQTCMEGTEVQNLCNTNDFVCASCESDKCNFELYPDSYDDLVVKNILIGILIFFICCLGCLIYCEKTKEISKGKKCINHQ